MSSGAAKGNATSAPRRSLLRRRDFGLITGAIGLSALGDWLALVPSPSTCRGRPARASSSPPCSSHSGCPRRCSPAPRGLSALAAAYGLVLYRTRRRPASDPEPVQVAVQPARAA